MSFAILGGLLLNIGTFLTYKGKIYESVIVYLLADMCWMIMAYESEDFWGVSSILVGITFGFLAFLKMKNGEMNKNINRKKDDI